MYEVGKGCKKDLKKAFELIDKSAASGHPECQCNLGTIYFI